ncbi:MAG: hypothetical protein WCB68_08240 [Pyrinomonadaceae bacterium]
MVDEKIASEEILSDIPSRQETLAEALGSLFSVGKSGVWGVVIFALGVASLGWLADSLLPILQDLAVWSFAKLRGGQAITSFKLSLIKSVFPLLIFGGLIVVLFLNRLKSRQPTVYASKVPDPHQGLIVMLSPYSETPTATNFYTTAAALVAAIEMKALDIDKVLSGCNWGQLAFVVGYHAPLLKKCWIVVTKGKSENDYENVKLLIEFLVKQDSGVDVECEKVVVKDENDIGETARVLSRLYRDIESDKFSLKPVDVIADFTGGTSAMSGGMILATLEEGREVEYVIRGITLHNRITRGQISAMKLIVSPRTSPRMVRTFGRS